MKTAELLQFLSDARIESVPVGSLPVPLDAADRVPLVKSPPLSSRRLSGFTLIELITVMLIIGIMAVVVLPRFDLLKGFDEIGYRDKVKATLEYARKSAVAQRRYVCAVIDASSDMTLTIESVNPEDVGHSTACPYTRALTLPALDSQCVAGVTNMICNPGSVTLTPAATLQFDPLGRATLGAGSYTVTGESAKTITVVAETGHVL